ncbi:MAG: shikimate dehydrogenase [Bacteroidota bacterium]|nr:shikimate dehydrogenase [Bacteroidota bacterium]
MKFGLIGYPLGHSFSKPYFESKFQHEGLTGFVYNNYPLEHPDLILDVLRTDVKGFNVTIPYKSVVLKYINDIDATAWSIGAVNTLVRTGANSWKGFNTDWMGFRDDIKSWFGTKDYPERALILGTGGVAKAIRFALSTLGISSSMVSSQGNGDFTYDGINKQLIRDHLFIVNATPVGMLPETERAPILPYEALTKDHWMFDVIYNPANTLFLAHGKQMGAQTRNGLDMLHLQAEHAWLIWKTYGKF